MRPALLRPVLAAAALACALVGAAPAAGQLRPLPPVLLSGAAPAACGAPAGVQAGAEVEPHLAVDPAEPARLALAWQQDRDRGGGAAALGLRLSQDGGRTWTAGEAPGLTTCPLAFGDRASDPWLAFGAQGRLWLASVPGSRVPGPLPTTRVAVATSPSPGAPFGPPAFADAGPAFHDKETLTAHPTRPGVAYAVWTLGARAGFFARTQDGGATWSAPVRIAPGDGPRPALGLVLHVVRGDELVVVLGTGPLEGRVRVVRSTDGGRTWTTPRTVAGERELPEPRGLRTGAFLPQVGARGRRVVVARADVARRTVRLAESRDGGRTWTRERAVVRGPGTPFLPAVAVGRDGTVAMTTHHLRGRRVEVRAHLRGSGGRWRARRLTSFALAGAPRAGADRFLADYTGLVAVPGGFVAAYVVAGGAARSGPSDVAVQRLRAVRPGG